MAYPALPTFPTSTTTSFDDLIMIREGQHFVLRGYEYRALEDACVWSSKGVETVRLDAERRHDGMPSGWELTKVCESRAYVGTLDEICD